MQAVVVEQPVFADARPVWRFDWLTPARCRLILAAVLALGFAGHLAYLMRDCPIDLSGDEAHYWDWSRQLDLSYYSKGPLVAYIIRASCAVFGDTMWAVRLPAIILSIGTGIVTYLLTRKLFGSERLALGAVLLNALVPMFIAGSVLMTIDPPFFFCWALATYLAALVIFDDRRRCWPLIGVVVGIGFLAKYAMLLWLPILLIALWVDRPSRQLLRTPGPWLAAAIALLFTTPVIVWNARHGWPTLWHVARQTGTDTAARFDPLNVLGFLGGQIGVLGPTLVVLMVAAVVYALFADSGADATNAAPTDLARDNSGNTAANATIVYATPKLTPTVRERIGAGMSPASSFSPRHRPAFSPADDVHESPRQSAGQLAGAGVFHAPDPHGLLPIDAPARATALAPLAMVVLRDAAVGIDDHADPPQFRPGIPIGALVLRGAGKESAVAAKVRPDGAAEGLGGTWISCKRRAARTRSRCIRHGGGLPGNGRVGVLCCGAAENLLCRVILYRVEAQPAQSV
jgi:hypothetical protein